MSQKCDKVSMLIVTAVRQKKKKQQQKKKTVGIFMNLVTEII